MCICGFAYAFNCFVYLFVCAQLVVCISCFQSLSLVVYLFECVMLFVCVCLCIYVYVYVYAVVCVDVFI